MLTYAKRLMTMCAALLLCSCSDGAPNSRDKGTAENQTVASANAARPLGPATQLIVAFGDSLFAGYGLAPNQGLAPELERALSAAGRDVRVHNAGVSGDTSAAGLARLAFTLDGLERTPDLVIVGLGGNDMLRGLSPDQTRANLDAILSELDRRGIAAMLTGMQASPNMGADYVTAFNTIYADLARRRNATLYPFYFDGLVGQTDLFLPDGIHPNDRGIDVVVARLAPVVASALPNN